MKDFKTIKANVDAKLAEFWFRTRQGINNALFWAQNNPELAMALIPVLTFGLKRLGKTKDEMRRNFVMRKEQELKDRYVYDRSIGMYHKLRRPLKQSERQELVHRKANGEKMANILASMRVLE